MSVNHHDRWYKSLHHYYKGSTTSRLETLLAAGSMMEREQPIVATIESQLCPFANMSTIALFLSTSSRRPLYRPSAFALAMLPWA
jgi:hypothetical protein